MASQNPVLTQHNLQVALDEPLMPETPTFESRLQTVLCFPWLLPPLAATATDTRVGGSEAAEPHKTKELCFELHYVCTVSSRKHIPLFAHYVL